MAKYRSKSSKISENDGFNTKIRKKLGLTQAHFAGMLGVSRAYLALAESGKRNLHSSINTILAKMNLQFHELETGQQASYRSLETRLFLNEEYKRILPAMKQLEKDCRRRGKQLKEELAAMKRRARDAEHAIIVLSTLVNEMEEKKQAGNEEKDQQMIEGLKLFKQEVYDNLLSCWEPEQAKLNSRIEATAGEARALRRYRLKIMKDHAPLKGN